MNPKDYHKDYYPKDDLYKMVGGYFADHHPPTENNFNGDHSELEEKSNVGFKRPKVNEYSIGSYEEEDPEFRMSSEKYNKPQSKSDDLADKYIQDDEDPYTDTRARSSQDEMKNSREKNGDTITNAFHDEWTHNPDDEMTKQVIGYFQDDKEDEYVTTRRPVVRKNNPPPPIPSPLSPSPLSRIVYHDNSPDQKIPNNYHPFSGFYYKNKFNSA